MKTTRRQAKAYAFAGALIVILGAAGFFVRERAAPITYESAATTTPPRNQFDDVSISAKGAAVFDANKNSSIFEKDGARARPLASVTKLMTAYGANGILASTSSVPFEGGEWRYRDLRDVMLVASSNEAADAIAAEAAQKTGSDFIGYLNKLASQKGWVSLSFKNPSGLDIDDAIPTNFGSPEDVARLMQALIRDFPDTVEPTREPGITRNGSLYENTNVTVNDIASILGSKTGFTNAAGGNLAIAYNVGLNRPIIMVVLGSRDENTRFSDIRTLIDTTESYLETHAN